MEHNTPKSILNFWREDIKIYPNGIARHRRGRVCSPLASSPAPRGNITRFTSHSSLRLRRALLDNTLSTRDYVNLGITLTLPWSVKADTDLVKMMDDYKIAFHRFQISFRRRFSTSASIYRHEIQKRGAPHSHIVLWLSRLDYNYIGRGRAATSGEFRAIVYGLWSRAVAGFSYDYSRLDHFARRGVLVDRLSDNIAMYRYISDHASKKKVSQLGYQGKQWGFINKPLFVTSPSVNLKFNRSSEYICFCRHISKVSRFFVGSGSKRKLSSRSMNRSVVFVKNRTSLNLYAAIKDGRVCSATDCQHALYNLAFTRLKKYRPSSAVIRNL